MNVLLRVTSCRVLEQMKTDPKYAQLIGLTDASKFCTAENRKPEGGQKDGRQQ